MSLKRSHPSSDYDNDDNVADGSVPPLKRAKLVPSPEELQSPPDPILFFLKKNASPKLLLKLMQTSKYFRFDEFPYLVTPLLSYDRNVLEYFPFGHKSFELPSIDMENITKPLWIFKSMFFFRGDDKDMASRVLSHTAVCDVKSVWLDDQNLTYDQLKICLSSKGVEEFTFQHFGNVKYESGDIVPLEEIIKLLPSCKDFNWTCQNMENQILPTSTKAIVEALGETKMKNFSLLGLPEAFDIDIFDAYMKANPTTCFELSFCDTISDEYCTKLQAYVNELVESGEYRKHKIVVTFPRENEDYYQILVENSCAENVIYF